MTSDSGLQEIGERHANVLDELRQELATAVAIATQRHSRFVLLDVPAHSNVGDHAIHLGELALIRTLGGRIVYRSNLQTNIWAMVEREPEAAILLHGGGNLGDLWPRHQLFREEVSRRFPYREIVVMPQTVWFRTKESLEQAKRAFGGHRFLTLMLRDRPSLSFCVEHFDARTYLCPDPAFALRLRARELPSKPVIALLRTDKERRVGTPPLLDDIPTVDWTGSGSLPLWTSAGIATRTQSRLRGHGASLLASKLIPRTYDPVARYHVSRGARILSRGKVVITDRLHGHVLSMILGIPHVVLDNSYGKVLSFVNTWSIKSPLVRIARSVEEASALALQWSRDLIDTPGKLDSTIS